MDRRVLVATRNAGKLREIRALLTDVEIDVVDLDAIGVAEGDDEAGLENAATFEGNALAKARYFYGRTGLATLADDTGLCVDALGGAPGTHSRRWSGIVGPEAAVTAANVALLLDRVRGVADRRATFVTVAAYVGPGGEYTRDGRAVGRIPERPSGEGGFGYDPVFLSDELGMTFADASPSEKASVSHRARAFTALFDALGWRGSERARRVTRAVDGR